jgi:BlaI family transcriptional regulator, penicillinase repressor
MTEKKISEIRLGRLELRIMTVVWEKSHATVHEVLEALSEGRPPAYSTILTMMRKLEAKGYLAHNVEDRTFVYRPTISQRDVRHGVLGDILDRLFDGSPSLLLNSLVEQKHINEKELREIQKLIQERAGYERRDNPAH